MIREAITDTCPLAEDKERLPRYEEEDENWSRRKEMTQKWLKCQMLLKSLHLERNND